MSGTASMEAAAWLKEWRAAARSRFELAGIPKPTDEDWRQTNVLPVAAFAANPARRVALDRAAIDAMPLTRAVPHRAVLVNGRFDPASSSLEGLPSGVRVRSLAAVLQDSPESLETHLGRAASLTSTPFVALNSATFVDGVVVTVDARFECPAPLHVVHVAAPGSDAEGIQSRVLLVAGAGARLTLIESFVAAGGGTYLTNAVTEIVTEQDAGVTHVKIQDEARTGWHVAAVAGHQARGSSIQSHNVSLGATLARNDIGSRLDGAGAECRLYGLYMADGSQHVDNHTWLDHAMPDCPSWEMYKGLLAGQARAVFCGRIVVREGAQKTDAKQSNKNLLLGDGALVFTRPQLEIHANDVKCTHGATIGRLDDEALFYLRTRGIGAAEARNVMVHAFAADLLQLIPVPEIRDHLTNALHTRLQDVA